MPIVISEGPGSMNIHGKGWNAADVSLSLEELHDEDTVAVLELNARDHHYTADTVIELTEGDCRILAQQLVDIAAYAAKQRDLSTA